MATHHERIPKMTSGAKEQCLARFAAALRGTFIWPIARDRHGRPAPHVSAEANRCANSRTSDRVAGLVLSERQWQSLRSGMILSTDEYAPMSQPPCPTVSAPYTP